MTIQADHNSGAKFSDYTTAPIENERAIDEADVNTASVVDRLKRVGGCSESLHNKSLSGQRVNISTVSKSRSLSGKRLHPDRRSVTEYLGNAFHQLVRVITNADHRVGARQIRLVQHCIERLLAGSFSEFREKRDVPTQQGLQARTHGAEHRP
jgi:hypothetical protein